MHTCETLMKWCPHVECYTKCTGSAMVFHEEESKAAHDRMFSLPSYETEIVRELLVKPAVGASAVTSDIYFSTSESGFSTMRIKAEFVNGKFVPTVFNDRGSAIAILFDAVLISGNDSANTRHLTRFTHALKVGASVHDPIKVVAEELAARWVNENGKVRIRCRVQIKPEIRV